jgi:hypothetical protein
MTGPRGRLLLAAAALALLAGCGGLFTAQVDEGPPLPTSQASLSAGIASTLSALRAALEAPGFRLDPPVVAYRPSEPASMVQTPRAVYQASVGDPAQGYVVIYQLADPAAAATAAGELASHLASGFGQTNFPTDAQFHVATHGSTVVFTWWSRERAADDDAAETAFRAMGSVGIAVPVLK